MCAPISLGLRLLAAVLFVLLLGAGDARLEELGAQARRINSQRLQATLEKLSEFGRHPEGGVTRLGFLQADLDARTYVTSLMKDAGLEIRVDPAGNIFGRRSGSDQLPTILFGSHINSVPRGGNFDGPLGSLGAIEVIRTLNDNHLATRQWRGSPLPLDSAARPAAELTDVITSGIGTKQTSVLQLIMSAFGGKADIPESVSNVR